MSVFGPERFSVPWSGSKTTNKSFQGLADNQAGTLIVQNGDGEDIVIKQCTGSLWARFKCECENLEERLEMTFTRPKEVEITLNGKVVLAKNQLPPAQGKITLPITVNLHNQLVVKTIGIPGSSVTVQIKSQSTTQNQLPISQFSFSPSFGVAPELISFSALTSYDPDGTIQSYQWSFGDGTTATGSLVTHQFLSAASFSVTLTVTDDRGGIGTKSQTVLIKANQLPLAQFTSSSDTSTGNFTLNVDAGLSTDTDGSIVDYRWDFGDGASASGVTAQHLYAAGGTYAVKLTVKDNKGGLGSVTQNISMQDTVPPVLTLSQPQSGAVINSQTVHVAGSANEALSSATVSFESQVFQLTLSADKKSFSGDVTALSSGTKALTINASDMAGNSASTQASVGIDYNLPPVAVITTVKPQQDTAPLMVSFDGSQSTDPEGQALTYSWDLGDGSPLQTSAKLTHEFVTAGSHNVVLTVKDNKGATSTATVNIVATTPLLLPAPETVAPTMSQTVPTSFDQQVSFIYSGANPLQSNVIAGAIKSERASVLRGQVIDGDGAPLAGAKIQFLDHPEVGETFSRADGYYDIVTNGGGTVTVNISRNGYLPSQRKVSTSANDYSTVPVTALVRLDSKVTQVSFGGASQFVTGSVSTDAQGTRTGALFIPSSTSAQIVLPSGATVNANQVGLRITEYTVGANGPKRMPADLPARSAYTYAMDVSADEALVMGSDTIKFSQPVSYYVDNFLNAPAGIAVPLAYYDYQKSAWIPENDGVVVKIIGVDAQGLAQLDVNGSGTAASTTALQALAFTSEELASLATHYSVGKTLWRVKVDHFCPTDLNFVEQMPGQVVGFSISSTRDESHLNHCSDVKEAGCIIDMNRRIVREKLDLMGSGMSLNYSTERQPGRNTESTVTIAPFAAKDIQAFALYGVQDLYVSYDFLGRHVEQKYTVQPNLTISYAWDGKDVYGRDVFGTIPVTVKFSFFLKNYYGAGNYLGPASTFGSSLTSTSPAWVAQAPMYAVYGRSTVVQIRNTAKSGINNLIKNEMGSWTLNMHHHLDVKAQKVYFGDGSSQAIWHQPKVLSTIARGLNSPQAVLKVSDGSYLIAETAQITKLDSAGQTTLFASLPGIKYLAQGPDDSVYATDQAHNTVIKIAVDGTVSTFAGVGKSGFSGDGGDAALAQLRSPSGVAVTKANDVFIADTGNQIIRRVRPDHKIETYAGTPGVAGDANSGALLSTFNVPRGLAVDCGDTLYVMDAGNWSVKRVEPLSGLVTEISTAASYGQATYFPTTNFDGVSVSCSGEIYAVDRGNGVIFHVRGYPPWVVVGSLNASIVHSNIDGTSAQRVLFKSPSVILDGDENFIVAEAGENALRRFGDPSYPMSAGGEMIPSNDGTEIYQFDTNGTHLRTLFAKTGSTKWSFSYDTNGYLISVKDASGNITTLARDGAGNLLQIQAPFGRNYSVSMNSDSYLQALTLPTGEADHVFYTPDGLMTEFRPPLGNSKKYTYETGGYVLSETDAANQSQNFFFSSMYNSDATKLLKVSNRVSPMGRKKLVYDEPSATNASLATTYVTPDNLKNTFTVQSGSQFYNAYGNSDTDGIELSTDPRLGGGVSYQSNLGLRRASVSGGYTVTRSATVNSMFDFTETKTMSDNNFASTTIYKSSMKTFTNTAASGYVSSVVVDNLERPTQTQAGTFLPVQYSYNSLGQLSQIVQGTRTTLLSYDSSGFLSSVTDPAGQTTGFNYDGAGRLKAQTLPDGRVTKTNYDLNSNLVEIIPSGKQAHDFVMNVLDMFSVYTPPKLGTLATSTGYVYNPDQQLTQISRPDGRFLNFNYDVATARLLSVGDGVSEGVTYNYGSDGRVSYGYSSDGIYISYGYNLPNVRTYSGIFNLTINSDWHDLTRISRDDIQVGGYLYGVAGYSYDVDGLLNSVGPMTLQRNYSNHLITSTLLSYNLADAYTYSSYGELASATTSYSSSPLYKVLYSRDNLGRVTTKTETILGTTSNFDYHYDLAGRLDQVKLNGNLQSSYSYDSNSNRTSATIGGVSTSATYDEQDRLSTYGNNQYIFNVNGELERKIDNTTGKITAFVFDIFGQLKKVTKSDGTVVEYLQDPEHHRAVKKINGVVSRFFAYDQDGRLFAELNPDQSVKWRFIFMPGSHSPELAETTTASTVLRFVKDQLGSIRLVLDARTGQVLQRMDYDEFGNVTLDTNPGFQPFGYAGGIYDPDTKLVLFGARSYDPEVGRWTSKDPIGFGGGDTNLFGYVANDPVNFFDPDGLKKTFVYQGGNLSLYGDNGGQLFSGPAVSGPYGNGALPQGRYSVGGMRDNRSGSYSCSGSSGYSLDLNPQFSTNRTDLRIHPDGGVPGTLGCIGVSCGNGNADALGNILRGIYNQPMTPWIDLEVR